MVSSEPAKQTGSSGPPLSVSTRVRRDWVGAGKGGGRGGAGGGENSCVQNTDPHRQRQTDKQTQTQRETDTQMESVTQRKRTNDLKQPEGGDRDTADNQSHQTNGIQSGSFPTTRPLRPRGFHTRSEVWSWGWQRGWRAHVWKVTGPPLCSNFERVHKL